MKAVVTDITKLKVEVMVNSGNGKGPMVSGVSSAIRLAAGKKLQEEVYNICSKAKYKEGDCYISSSGDLVKRGVRNIYHAVTMEYPGGRSTLYAVGKAMRTILDTAIQNNVKSIAFPGLGTGIGVLDLRSVASIMVSVAKKYSNKVEITFADVNPQFIEYVRHYLEEIKNGHSEHPSASS